MTPRLRNLVGCVALLPVLAGCDKPAPKAAQISNTTPAASVVAPGTPPAIPTSFQEVAAQLDAGGSFYMYLSTEQWLAGLSQQIAGARETILSAAQPTPTAPAQDLARFYDTLVDLVAQSGIEDATGVGMSSFALGPETNRSKFFIHHAPGKGKGFLWTIWGGPAHPLDALQILPAQTALAMVQDVDFSVLNSFAAREVERLGTPEVKSGYEQGKQQLASILGMPVEEAFKSLSGPTGVIVTLDPSKPLQPQGPTGVTVPTPGLALVLHAGDERIFNQLDKNFGTNPQLIRVDEPGLKMRTLPDMPTPLGVTLRPTAALWGSYLIVASSDQLVRDMVAAKTSGFTTLPEFKQMSADVPTTGNGFQVVTKTFSDFVAQAQSEVLKSQPTTTPQQAALMKQILESSAGASGFTVLANLENGLLATSKTTSKAAKSNFAALLSGIVAASQSAAATKTDPATDEAPTGQAAESLKKAQQIYFGCVRYASDNAGRFPADLQSLVPRYIQDATLLTSPYAPGTPVGYKYTSGLSQDSPASTVLIEDSQAAASKMSIIVHVDGSTKVKKAP